MVNDSAALAEILAPTWLGGREITTIALKNGEVIFSHDVMITLAAREIDPATLVIEPIADPATRLLGPKPDEP